MLINAIDIILNEKKNTENVAKMGNCNEYFRMNIYTIPISLDNLLAMEFGDVFRSQTSNPFDPSCVLDCRCDYSRARID